MPIKLPKYVNVIAFFGGDSFDHLVSMLRYYHTTLDQEAWQSFLFILATPGSKGVGSLPDDLPPYIKSQCWDGTGDCKTIIYLPTANAIRRMYRDGNLNLHLICDDFKTALFPAEAPADMAKLLRKILMNGQIKPYYYCFLDTENTQRQRQLAQTFVDSEAKGEAVFPYLLSQVRDDHSLAQPEQLWRALMCEILVISQGDRMLQEGTVSALGYTSLNANEKELIHLRRQALIERLSQECQASYPELQAWQDLLHTTAPLPEGLSDDSAREFIREWLRERIQKDLPNPSPERMNNFRILSGVCHQDSPDSLFGMAKRFYQINLNNPAAGSGAQENKKPEYLAAQKHLRMLLSQLVLRPNLCSFPKTVLDLIIRCLSSLCSDKPSPSYPSYPKKQLLQNKTKYMLSCCEIAERAARQSISEELIPVYARAYGEMFTYLRKQLQSAADIKSELNELMLPGDRCAQLRGKYPTYYTDIQNTITLLQVSPFRGVVLYDEANTSPRIDRILSALEQADAVVHSKMSPGFDSSFIDAIKHEFTTAESMNAFLSNYLNDGRRLFFNIVVPRGPAGITYFCNNLLSNTEWADKHKANTYFVSNDNVERLDYFALSGGRYQRMSDYLSAANASDEHNHYFCQTDDPQQIVLPNISPSLSAGASSVKDAPSSPAQTSAQNETAAQAVSLHLANVNGSWHLTWNWAAESRFYRVYINGEQNNIHSEKYFKLRCMDVTDQLVSGRNHIVLCDLNDNRIAEGDFCGPKKKVSYRKTHNALYVSYVPEAIHSLVVQESIRTYDRDGKLIQSYFYYPLGLVDTPRTRDVICYEKISFSSEWNLVSDPTNPFCVYAPSLNVNL